METKIRLLNKRDIPACLKLILETGVSGDKKEAKRILALSLKKGRQFYKSGLLCFTSRWENSWNFRAILRL